VCSFVQFLRSAEREVMGTDQVIEPFGRLLYERDDCGVGVEDELDGEGLVGLCGTPEKRGQIHLFVSSASRPCNSVRRGSQTDRITNDNCAVQDQQDGATKESISNLTFTISR
jgi:hypothetical protein